MLMVTVPPKTKRGNLSGTNSFRCHFIFHSSGSLETRLCNGGVGNPPHHHNTMLFMLNAFHVYEHGSHAGSATPSGDEDEDAKGGTEEEEEEEEEAEEDDRTCVTGCVLQVI